MTIFFDEKLDFLVSQTKINLTFKTKALENGSGAEERIISWLDPLLSFDISRSTINDSDRQYLQSFFNTVRGNAYGFRFRDCSDYQATATGKVNKYGSITQGRLFPEADGVRTEFQLFKIYQLEGCLHYRAITRPSEITIFENGVEVTDWSEEQGKITFITAPSGELTADIIFDVPVAFAHPQMASKTNRNEDEHSSYRLEPITIEEIREEAFYYPIDILGSLPLFPLIRYPDSTTSVREQTEIIDLTSGYDKRTPLSQQPKGHYTLPNTSLYPEELDHLIAFWRCCKGRGLHFYLDDRSYHNSLVAVRFDEDNLAIEVRNNHLFTLESIPLIQTYDSIPLALVLENNPNLEIVENIITDVDASTSEQLVNTSPTVIDDGSGISGGSGGSDNSPNLVGTIIAISEAAGKLILLTFSSGTYRIYIERTSQQLDFIKAGQIATLNSNYDLTDFVDLSDSKKGAIFTGDTANGKKLFAVTVTSSGAFQFDSTDVVGTDPGDIINYTLNSSLGPDVFLNTYAQSPVPASVNIPEVNWSSLGMTITNYLTIEGRKYRTGNYNGTVPEFGFGKRVFAQNLYFYDRGEYQDRDIVEIQHPYYKKTEHWHAWISTMSGIPSPYFVGGVYTGNVYPIESQEGVKNILYSITSTQVETRNSTIPGEDNVYVSGFFPDVSFYAQINNTQEIIFNLTQESTEISLSLGFFSETSQIAQAPLNNPHNYSIHPYYSKNYQNRYYGPSSQIGNGLPYLKQDGTVGNAVDDFSLLNISTCTAVYVSETRGLVFASGNTLRYLLVTAL